MDDGTATRDETDTFSREKAFSELMALYREKSLPQRLRAMVSGLRRPRGTQSPHLRGGSISEERRPVRPPVFRFLTSDCAKDRKT